MEELRKQFRSQIEDKAPFELARRHAYDYMEKIAERNVYPTPEALRRLAVFREALPESPGDPIEILDRLHAVGSPATVAQTGGRYFGFVNGNAIPAVLAAKWLADVWDQNAAAYVTSPVISQLESVCESWLTRLLGLPEGSAAGLVSGTAAATLCGLVAGRNHLLHQMGWDVHSKGLFNAPEIRVMVGAHAHATVFKALALIGLGRERVCTLPADSQGRIIPEQVPPLDRRTLLILQAGEVNTGAFDPLDRLCGAANDAGTWVHVDGAFGLWAAACRTRAHLTKGVEKADSWSLDAHKTLNAPYDCGIVLCKDRKALAAALHASGAYIPPSAHRDNMHYTPDMSRRARAVELWATLKALGRQGVERLVEELCQRAEQFSRELRKRGFRILNDVVFNQVLVACETPERTQTTLNALQAGGTCWCGGSMWQGEPVIRINVCSWATTAADVDRCVDAFVAARSIL
jgi:glutamate/tyrosine decarboxylase-like PLP-dependent enzyme